MQINAPSPGEFARDKPVMLILYALLTSVCFGALAVTLVRRQPFEANIARLAGVPWVLEGATVRNQFEVHLVNKAATAAQLTLSVTSPVPAQIRIAEPAVVLQSFEDRRVQVVVTIDRANLPSAIDLEVAVMDAAGQRRVQKLHFLSPR